jgi:rare lipoprotein A
MDPTSYDISRSPCPTPAFRAVPNSAGRLLSRKSQQAMQVKRDLHWHATVLMAAACLIACSGSYRQISSRPAPVAPPHISAVENATFTQVGRASWYGRQHQGRLTASGERFNMYQMTAAHRTLPLGTVIRVTNPANGTTVKVRINDRGPYIKGRVLDLSATAAKALGISRDGVAKLRIEAFASDQTAD